MEENKNNKNLMLTQDQQKKIDNKILQYRELGFEVEYKEPYGYTLKKYIGTGPTVEIPEGIERINMDAFDIFQNAYSGSNELKNFEGYKRPNIKKIIFPSSIKTINERIFYFLHSLEEIVLPDSFTDLYYLDLSKCIKIKKITTSIDRILLPQTSILFFKDVEIIYHGIHLKFPKEALGAYSRSPSNLQNKDSFKELYSYKYGSPRLNEYSNPTEIDLSRELILSQFVYFPPKSLDQKDNTKETFYTSVLKYILERYPYYNLKADIITHYNEDIFIENLNIIYEALENTISPDSITEIIGNIFIKNTSFVSVSIEKSIKENYMFLVNERVINESILQEIFFEKNSFPLISTEIKSGEFSIKKLIENLAKERISSSKILNLPELFSIIVVEPTKENQLELRDRLVYISTMGLLEDNNPEKKSKAIQMFKRTNFENIVENDYDEYRKETKDKYDRCYTSEPKFAAIRLSLYEKMNGINENLFTLFIEAMSENSTDSYYKHFFESLSTVKNWNYYSDLKQRATYLKNEIIARLLYGMIYWTEMDLRNNNGEREYTEEEIFASLKDEPKLINRILKVATGSPEEIFNNEKYIRLMLKIDPYSFDAFRNSNETLEARYWQFAKRYNYLFTLEDAQRYEILNNNGNPDYEPILRDRELGTVYIDEVDEYGNPILKSNGRPRKTEKRDEFGNVVKEYQEVTFEYQSGNLIRDIAEYINNEIGIAKIPEKEKSQYLEKVRTLARSYTKTHTEEELFSFLRSIDLYMRTSNEYTIQQPNENKKLTSLTMFDPQASVKREDRLFYTLYNLNRLAHSTTERNLLYDVHHRNRIDLEAEKEERNILKNIVTDISELMQYGLDFYRILEILKGEETGSKSLFSDELSDKDEYSQLLRVISDKEQARVIIENLKIRDRMKYLKDSVRQQDAISEITEEKFPSIVEKFRYLKSVLNENRLQKIKNYAEERFTFFETKRIIAEEFIKKFTYEIGEDLIEVAFASEDIKKEFYARNGFVIEIQSDTLELKSHLDESKREKLDSESRMYYDEITQRINGQNITGPLVIEVDNHIVEVIPTPTSPNEPPKYKYIIHKTPVLVCYSEQFNETFSIHLKDLAPRTIEEYKRLVSSNSLVQTICNTKLSPPGLSIRKEQIRPEFSADNISRAAGKFIPRTKKNEADYTVALFNFFTYDIERIKYQNNLKLSKIKSITSKGNISIDEIEIINSISTELSLEEENNYFNRFVDNPETMNNMYKKVFGIDMPDDVLGIRKLKQELSLELKKCEKLLLDYKQMIETENQSLTERRKGMN